MSLDLTTLASERVNIHRAEIKEGPSGLQRAVNTFRFLVQEKLADAVIMDLDQFFIPSARNIMYAANFIRIVSGRTFATIIHVDRKKISDYEIEMVRELASTSQSLVYVCESSEEVKETLESM